MTIYIIIFLAGFLIGGFIGGLIMAFCNAAHRSEVDSDRMIREAKISGKD